MVAAVKPAELRDHLVEQNRYFASSDDLCELLGVQPESLYGSLHRPSERGEIVNVCPGGWVAVPEEDERRSPNLKRWPLPPLTWYVDDMIGHLGHRYYIGHWAAAERWGMAHHQTPCTTVVTTARTKHRTREDPRFPLFDGPGWIPTAKYVHCGSIDSKQTDTQASPEGWLPAGVEVVYSSREVTLLDLVQVARTGPAVDRSCDAACLLLLGGNLDIARLAEQALAYPFSVRQRTGRILDAASEHMGIPCDTGPLADTLSSRIAIVPLFPHGDNWPILYDEQGKNEVHLPWRVEQNGLLDPDV